MARFSKNGFPLLEYYMGKNTMERQKFIIDNLRIEDDSEMDKMLLLSAKSQRVVDDGVGKPIITVR